MKRILSVDWDYFVKATAAERFMLFPDGGNENISPELQLFIWNSRYAYNPQIRDISVLRFDYEAMHSIIDKFGEKYRYSEVSAPHREVLVTISHKWAYDFIKQRTRSSETFEVYNVDFHHDMYHYRLSSDEVNCGNWVNKLLDIRPNMKYHWIKREDSDENSIGDVPVACDINTMQEIKDLDFDYIFICRSDCWSPPHLDNYFETLWVFLRKFMPVEIETAVMKCRKLDTPTEAEARFGAEKALAKSMEVYPNATCINCGEILPEGSSSFVCARCNAKDN